MDGLKRVCVVGGGTGNALAYPLACGMHKHGVETVMIAGFKTKDLVILEEEFRAGVDELYVMTDDGSYGEKGFTTAKLEELIQAGEKFDEVIARRTADDDEVHLPDCGKIWHPLRCFLDRVHDRRYRYVRRLQMQDRRRR